MSGRAVRYEVSFWNGASLLDADLVVPTASGARRAAVLVSGGSGPRDRRRWVETLALSGIATLSWDSPGHGTSLGPRAWQAPHERALEVVAAAEFLHSIADHPAGGVALVGADAGAWAAALAAALSSRVGALALVTPPCTDVGRQEVHRLGRRLGAAGFLPAETALAQLVLAERIRALWAGYDAGSVLRAEAPCWHAPWYPWLPGTTEAELESFASLAGYLPRALLAPVHCPVLGIFGADDDGTPVSDNALLLREALTSSPCQDHHLLVVHQTLALSPASPWAATGSPAWHGTGDTENYSADLVSALAGWLGPTLGQPRPTGTPAVGVPRAG